MILQQGEMNHFAAQRFWPAGRLSLRRSPGYLVGASWLLFAAYWLVTALDAKAASKVEKPSEWIGHIVLIRY